MERSGFASLASLFAALETALHPGKRLARAAPPEDVPRAGAGDLFSPGEKAVREATVFTLTRASGIPGPESFGPVAAALFARSPAAWDTVLLAWMSERVNEQILRRFAFHVITSVADAPHGNAAGYGDAVTGDEEEQVRAAAYKVSRELHRIRGFLRFSPDRCGIYTARCAPDHFVLPALAVHFTARFGAAPWAIRDEKRRLVLTPFPVAGERGAEGGPADFCLMDAAEYDAPAPGREYAAEADRIAEDCATQHRGTENDAEDLWRIYHGSVSNADRQNPALQKRFMPARYRPYLPECFPAGTTFPDRPDADGAGE